jgi:hypothetical protein
MGSKPSDILFVPDAAPAQTFDETRLFSPANPCCMDAGPAATCNPAAEALVPVWRASDLDSIKGWILGLAVNHAILRPKPSMCTGSLPAAPTLFFEAIQARPTPHFPYLTSKSNS